MAEMALKVRHAGNLVQQATIVMSPANQDRYPGSSLETWYVCRLARYCVADVLRFDPLLMIGKPRGPRKMAFARQLTIHLAHIVAGRRHDEVAKHFSRNRSTASHHFEVLENLRDVPEFDLFLIALEQRFSHLLHAAETRPVEAWGAALHAMQRAVRRGELESDTHFDAKFVTETFRNRDRARAKR